MRDAVARGGGGSMAVSFDAVAAIAIEAWCKSHEQERNGAGAGRAA
jgi:hypothetical protein